MSTFPDRLAKRMSETRFNNSTLGRKLGVTHSTVARWLNGSMPSGETLHRLAHELCVSVQWLLGDDPTPPEPIQNLMRDESPAFRYQGLPKSDDLEVVMEMAVRPIYQAPDEAALWPHAEKLFREARDSTGDLGISLVIVALQEIRKRRKAEAQSK